MFQVTGVGYNSDGCILVNGVPIASDSHRCVSALVETGVLCNNARIQDNTLLGQPTEGALVALAMKVFAILKFEIEPCLDFVVALSVTVSAVYKF